MVIVLLLVLLVFTWVQTMFRYNATKITSTPVQAMKLDNVCDIAM